MSDVFFPLLPGRWENNIALLSLVAPPDLAVGGHFPVEEGSLESRYLMEGNQTRWGFQISRFFQIQILLHIMTNSDHSASISWLFFLWNPKKMLHTPGKKNIISPPKVLGKMIFGLTRLVGPMSPFPGWFNPHWFGQAFTNLGSYSCRKGIPVDGNRLLGYLKWILVPNARYG